jgi:thiosulfate dehydrogenase [quinone] large subunit
MSTPSSRRHFLRSAAASIGLAMSAATVATLVAGCETDESNPTPSGTTFTLDVASVPELATVGGISLRLITGLNDGAPVFISRIAQNTFVVFSSICTHAGCEVNPPAAAGADIICSCHGAQFASTDGAVKRQPNSGSATDLKRFPSAFNSTTNILTISA